MTFLPSLPTLRVRQCFIVLADASNTASLTAGLDQALSHISPSFPLQSVIYNAAARIESPFLKLQEKHLETSYKLNQLAPWTICQRTLPIMVKQGFVRTGFGLFKLV